MSSQNSKSFSSLEDQNLLPGSSKDISMEKFKKTDEMVSENSEMKNLAILLSHSESRLRNIFPETMGKDVYLIIAHHFNEKLKEIIKAATDYMTKCGRSKFTIEDFNKGLEFCGENPIMQYETLPLNVKKRKRKPKGNKKIRNKPKFIQNCAKTECVYIKEMWLNETTPLSVSINDLSDELKDYLKAVTEVLFSSHQEMTCIILSDLQINRNIFQLVPYLTNFFCDTVNKYKCNFLNISLLFKLLNVLLQNPYLYFGQDSYLNILSCTLLKFLVSDLPNCDQGKDCWLLKDTAANILVLILNRSKDQHLFFEAIYFAQSVLLTFKNSMNSHYGALVALNAIGVPAILLVLPSYVHRFHEHVKNILSLNIKKETGVHMVQGQIIRSYNILVNYYFKNEVGKPNISQEHSKFLFPYYLKDIKVFPVLSQSSFSDYFGEALLPAFPALNLVSHSTFLREKKKTRKRMNCASNSSSAPMEIKV